MRNKVIAIGNAQQFQPGESDTNPADLLMFGSRIYEAAYDPHLHVFLADRGYSVSIPDVRETSFASELMVKPPMSQNHVRELGHKFMEMGTTEVGNHIGNFVDIRNIVPAEDGSGNTVSVPAQDVGRIIASW